MAFHIWFVRHVVKAREKATESLQGLLTGSEAAKKRYEELEAERKRKSAMSSHRMASSKDFAKAVDGPSSKGYTQLVSA